MRRVAEHCDEKLLLLLRMAAVFLFVCLTRLFLKPVLLKDVWLPLLRDYVEGR